MPNFTVTSSLDGKQYNVEAASKDDAQSMVDDRSNFEAGGDTGQQLPQGTVTEPRGRGTVYQTPEGQVGYFDEAYSTTDPEEIRRIIGGEDPAEMFQQRVYEDVVQQRPAAARGAVGLRGVPFAGEYLDELGGAVGGPQTEANVRLAQKAMEETRPIESALLETGVGMASTMPLAMAMPTMSGGGLMRVAERGLQAGGFGAAEGTVAGYGQGEGPMIMPEGGLNPERKAQAQSRGITSGAISAPLGAAGGMVENIVSRRIADVDFEALAAELGISREAARTMVNMGESGMSPAQIEQNIRNMGEEGRLVNAGPQSKRLLDLTQQVQGPATTTVQQGVTEYGRQVRRAFDQSLDRLLGRPAEGPKQVFEEARAATAPKRKAAYDEAYAQFIDPTSDVGRNIRGVLNQIPPRYKTRAIEQANELMQIDDVGVRSLTVDAQGNLTEYPNIIQLDYIKRGLGNIISEATDPVTNKMSPEGANASKLYTRLSRAMTRAVPQYGEAVNLGLENIIEENAIRLVNNFNRSNPEDFSRLIGQVDGEARDQLRDSMRRMLRTEIQRIEDRAKVTLADPEADMETARGAVNAFKAFSSSEALQKVSKILTGSELRQFRNTMAKAQEFMNLQYAVSRGSQTAFRTEGQKQIVDIAQPTLNEMVSGSGNLSEVVGKIARSVFGVDPDLPMERSQQVLDEIATTLLNTKGENAVRAARLIQEVAEGRPMSKERAQFAANIIGSALWTGMSESAQQYLYQE